MYMGVVWSYFQGEPTPTPFNFYISGANTNTQYDLITTIEGQTDDIGAAGAGLTGLPAVKISTGTGAGQLEITSGAIDNVTTVASVQSLGSNSITASAIQDGAIGDAEIADGAIDWGGELDTASWGTKIDVALAADVDTNTNPFDNSADAVDLNADQSGVTILKLTELDEDNTTIDLDGSTIGTVTTVTNEVDADVTAFEGAADAAAAIQAAAAAAIAAAEPVDANLIQMGGVAQSATDLKDFADAGYDPVNNEVERVETLELVQLNGTETSVAKSAGGMLLNLVQKNYEPMPGNMILNPGFELSLAGGTVDYWIQTSDAIGASGVETDYWYANAMTAGRGYLQTDTVRTGRVSLRITATSTAAHYQMSSQKMRLKANQTYMWGGYALHSYANSVWLIADTFALVDDGGNILASIELDSAYEVATRYTTTSSGAQAPERFSPYVGLFKPDADTTIALSMLGTWDLDGDAQHSWYDDMYLIPVGADTPDSVANYVSLLGQRHPTDSAFMDSLIAMVKGLPDSIRDIAHDSMVVLAGYVSDSTWGKDTSNTIWNGDLDLFGAWNAQKQETGGAGSLTAADIVDSLWGALIPNWRDSIKTDTTMGAVLVYLLDSLLNQSWWATGNAAGTGALSDTIYVIDTSGTDANIASVYVEARNGSGALQGQGTTNGSGYVVLNLPQSTSITVTGYLAGYTWVDRTVTTESGTTDTDTLFGYNLTIGSPSAANLKRVYGYENALGDTAEGLKIVATLVVGVAFQDSILYDTAASVTWEGGVTVVDRTDSSGLWQIDLPLTSNMLPLNANPSYTFTCYNRQNGVRWTVSGVKLTSATTDCLANILGVGACP